MARRQTQRSILAAEFYWYGGTLGAPKVYDSGTSFNADPTLRGPDSQKVASGHEHDAESSRFARFRDTGDGWEIDFDDAG